LSAGGTTVTQNRLGVSAGCRHVHAIQPPLASRIWRQIFQGQAHRRGGFLVCPSWEGVRVVEADDLLGPHPANGLGIGLGKPVRESQVGRGPRL